MRELGQFLRTKRESLGLSLDEVQERTKIRKRYLIALESGDWSVLPGYVYGRGFVRSYAEVLGLDGLELLQTYTDKPLKTEMVDLNGESVQVKKKKLNPDTSVGGEAPEPKLVKRDPEFDHEDEANSRKREVPKFAQTRDKVRRASHERVPSPATRLLSGRKFNTFSQIAVVVGVLAIIGGSLYALNRGKGPASLASDNASLASSVQNQSNAANALGAGENSTGLSSETNVSNNTSNTTSQTGAGTASIIPAAFQNNTQSYTVVTQNPLSVSLTATSGACWVKVSADNNIIDSSDMINQGMQKSWSANQSLTIRAGNVSAIQLEVNGQPVPLPHTTNAIDITFSKQAPQAQ